MLLEQDGFSKVSELSPGLVFATESVSELFKLTYPNLFENLLSYLNPVTFFHFVILSDWPPLLLRITFFFRIVEEEQNICSNMWQDFNRKIISTINVKMKTLSPKKYQLLLFEKILPHKVGIKKKYFCFMKNVFVTTYNFNVWQHSL